MTWVRYDDQFPIHRKVAGLTNMLYRLHTEAIFWCARNATDGVIRRDDLATVGPRLTPERCTELVRRNLWHEFDDICEKCRKLYKEAGTPDPVDGWVIHEYLAFQPSRAKMEKERQLKADRQAKWLAARKAGRGGRDASQDASVDASKDALETALETLTPPRPAPKGSGAKPRGASQPLASQGGGRRANENPDWRTLPAAGETRDPADVERARRGAAAARAELARAPKEAS